MLEANYLTILLKPNYEKAIDTAQDILDRSLTVIYTPGSESFVVESKNSPYEINRRLAERTIVPKVIFSTSVIILIMNFHSRIGTNMMTEF